MFDRTLNATLCPAVVPRDTTLALWPTPDALAGLVPPTPRSDAPLADFIELRGPSDLGPVTVACTHVPMDTLLSPPDASVTSSRSMRALTHVTRFALEIVERGLFHPDIAPSGVDTWSPGPLGPDEMAQVERLADLLPPEAFAVDGGAGDRTTAVLALIDSVVDLVPRLWSPSGPRPAGPWAVMEHSDVSRHRRELRSATITRRSVLQLRLVLPGDTHASRSGPRSGSAVQHADDDIVLWVFLRTRANRSLAVAASDVWSGVADLGEDAESDLLFLLRRAATVWEPLGRLLDDPTPSRLLLDPDEAGQVLEGAARELAEEGVEVLVPSEMVRRVTATPRVGLVPDGAATGTGGSTSSGLFTVDSLCDVTWTALAGDRQLSTTEIDRLMEERSRLVRLDDGWVLLDARTIERLRRSRRMDARRTLGTVLGGHQGLVLVPPLDDAGTRPEPIHRPPAPLMDEAISGFITSVLGAMTNDTFPEPRGLLGELRPYQRAGLSWSSRLFRAGFGGILADDMGLGKTVQMIALHLWADTHPSRSLIRAAPTLVVAPTGLIDNWAREFERWAPQVRVHRYHGPDRTLDGVSHSDVVVTSYGVVRRDIGRINELEWGLVIADEAQTFKNPDSATAVAMSSVASGVRFALTGTPVENHLGELWSLFEWTAPGLLGTRTSFTEMIADPIERHDDQRARERLRTLTAPFMLRRTKLDERIAPDLPPRTITDHRVDATFEQMMLYKAATDELLGEIQGSTGMARRGSILKLLTRLKAVTNHPAHHLGQTGPLPARSGKFDLVARLIDEIVDSGQSVVVFTQYVRMGELLVDGLGERGHPTRMLHGGLSVGEKASLVESFQQRHFPVLVVSLRAGGTGLNLTAATHVVHYDRWWNPAVENQASDRVWRIGQQYPVQVHRVMTRGTIEERIAELIDSKQSLADSVMGTSAWFTEVDDESLVELVLLRNDTDGSTVEQR